MRYITIHVANVNGSLYSVLQPSLLIGCGLKCRRDLVAGGAGLYGFDERWTLVGVDGDRGLADDVVGRVRLLGGLTGHLLAGKQAHVSAQEEPLNGARRESRLVRTTRIMC